MTHEQRLVFDEILNAVIIDFGGFYFFYGHDGCDKTFNGIAFLLLPGARTSHYRFLIPITITDESTCNIKYSSLKAELLIQSSLIIWDKTPILNKMCFEALDQMLKDFMLVTDQHKTYQPFSGKVLKLQTNMRLLMSSSDQHEGKMKRFVNWIFDVGNENISSVVGDESQVEISDDYNY
ncbi:uncharacterized protein LOC127747797 [Arachis duranensis]|uniref:ATP-dependent DNA helicase n=1 Tax=Arachis duranensis TaxID=130453 RepID=A0A9C6WUF8_ARADU|nr:uncharacterized protein LOC127747797 [Arachis duranensis]